MHMGMGNRLVELDERGFGDVDGSICLDHIADRALRDSLTPAATERECVYCDRSAAESQEPFAVPLEDLMAEIMTAVNYFYADALEVLPWDSEDGQWVGTVHDAYDVVNDLCADAFEQDIEETVMETVVDAIGFGKEWTQTGARGSGDYLEYAWDEYVRLVETTSRFVFVDPAANPRNPDMRPPVRTAAFLQNLLAYVDSTLGLVTTIPAGTVFFRGRLAEQPREVRPCAKDLGPAPSRLATANRMSPAGVSLFYASADAQTAVAEIASHGVKTHALVGAFRNTRDLKILDFTRAPSGSSVFEHEGRRNATMRLFLRTFVRAITEPMIPDGRQYIEYVPTQVLTEYFRWMPKDKVDGIALPSAQTGFRTFVMFFGPEAVADSPGEPKATDAAPNMFDLGADDIEPIFTLDRTDIAVYRVDRSYEAVPVKDTFDMWLRPREQRAE